MRKILLTLAVLVALAGTASACDYGNVRQLLQSNYGYSQNVQFASTCGYSAPVQQVQFVRQNYGFRQNVQFQRQQFYGYSAPVQQFRLRQNFSYGGVQQFRQRNVRLSFSAGY